MTRTTPRRSVSFDPSRNNVIPSFLAPGVTTRTPRPSNSSVQPPASQSGATANPSVVSPSPSSNASPTKNLFGVTSTQKFVPNKSGTGMSARITREERATLKPEERQKLYSTFLTGKDSGIDTIEDLGSSQDTIDGTYDTQLLVDNYREYLGRFQMDTLFKYVVTPKKDVFGLTQQDCEPKSANLFEDFARVEMEAIIESCNWWVQWMYDENLGENKWIPDDLSWSADLLKSKMSPEMLALIKDDLKSLYGISIEHQGGPVVFKALMDRLMSSNQTTIRNIQETLQGKNLKLEEYNGDIPKFCNRIEAAVKRLRNCEKVDANGNKLQNLVPDSLAEDLHFEFQKTGVAKFDTAFHLLESQATVTGMLQQKGRPDYGCPLVVLKYAKDLYRTYSISGVWTEKIANPSAFIATGDQGRCFGCGKVGCRKDSKVCPRNGKSPTPEGIAAKKEFWAAKNKGKDKKPDEGKGSGGTKWPERPKKGEANRKKIDGKWYYFMFKTNRWEVCDSQDDAENQAQISANLASNVEPSPDGNTSNGSDGNAPGESANGFFANAALMSCVPKGTDPQLLQLQLDIFAEKEKEAKAAFVRAMKNV